MELGKKMLSNLKAAAGNSSMYYGIQWDTAPAVFARLKKLGLVTEEQPHNPVHKSRAVVTELGIAQLQKQGVKLNPGNLPEYLQKAKIDPVEFAEALVDNEECMAENAAMAVTCDMFGIDIDEGYQLLIEAADLIEEAE